MKLLLVEDIAYKATAVKKSLGDEHLFVITEASTYSEVVNALSKPDAEFDAVLLDMKFPTRGGSVADNNGVRVLDHMKAEDMAIPTIIISGGEDTKEILTNGGYPDQKFIYWTPGVSIKSELKEFLSS